MNRNVILGLGAVIVLVAIAAVVYFFASSGSGEASETISAPTLSLADNDADAVTTTPEAAAEATDEATEEPVADEATATPEADDYMAADETEAPTADAALAAETPDADAADDASAADTSAAAADSRALLRIVSDESEARFTLNEELFGSPKTVVGTTSDVAGDIIVDFSEPANTELGTLRVNARTLTTDDNFRNRAIRGQILQSAQDEFEFIEFVPTALNDLPDSVAVGDTFTFEVVGDLTIRDITNSTTWTVEVTVEAEDRISGTAETEVLRGDYDLNIPDVPSVANVTDEVTLAIDFVAVAVTE